MAINPNYALQFKRTIDRASEARKARASGTVTAVSSDSFGKIKNATVSTGSGLISVPVPYGTNVYTGMTVSIANDGTPSNAQWRLYGTTSVPGGIQGGSIVNHDGNTFAMFDSIWVRGDGVIIVGGDVDIDGDPTGPRVESNQCGYFGYDQYDRQSLAIYAANCDGYYAGDTLLGPEEASRISILPTEGAVRIVNAGRTSLEFAPDGNFIRDPLTIGNPVGARINIGEIEDKATFVMRDKDGVAKLVARTDDASDVYIHVGNPPPEDNSMWFDSATGMLNVNGHVTMQSMDVRGMATFSSTGSFRIVDPDDPQRYGVITPRGIYAYSVDALGQQYLSSVDAWAPLTLETRIGSGAWKTWLAGETMKGDADYRHFRTERGVTGRVGLFNGNTPIAYIAGNGVGYFSGIIEAAGGLFTGDIEVTTGSIIFPGGSLGASGLILDADGFDLTNPNASVIQWVNNSNQVVSGVGAASSTEAAVYLAAYGDNTVLPAIVSISATSGLDEGLPLNSDVVIGAYGALGSYEAELNLYTRGINSYVSVGSDFFWWKSANNSAAAFQLNNASDAAIVTLDTTSSILKVNGTTKLGDGGVTNYAQFDASGNLTFHGSAGVTISGYLTATGTVTGATSQAQTFTNGIIGPTWKPASDSTTALQMQAAAGTPVIVNINTSSNAVGFGTTSPAPNANWYGGTRQSTVHINDTTTNLPNLRFTSTGADFTFACDNTNAYMFLTGTGALRYYTNSVERMNVSASGVAIGLTSPDSKLHVQLDDAATNAASQLLTLSHNTSDTVANGFGSRVLWELKSSTTADQTAAAIDVAWTNATHASRASGIKMQPVSSGGLVNALFVGPTELVVNDDQGNYDFRVEGDTSGYVLFVDASADAVGIGTQTPATRLHVQVTDARTNDRANILTVEHNTTGTAAAGFASGVLFQLESDTTTSQDAALIEAAWTTATHASRAGRLALYGSYTGTLYEGVRVGAVSGAAALGFYGVPAIARPTTSSAAASFTANSGTAVNDTSTFDGYTIRQVVKALRDIGLLT